MHIWFAFITPGFWKGKSLLARVIGLSAVPSPVLPCDRWWVLAVVSGVTVIAEGIAVPWVIIMLLNQLGTYVRAGVLGKEEKIPVCKLC